MMLLKSGGAGGADGPSSNRRMIADDAPDDEANSEGAPAADRRTMSVLELDEVAPAADARRAVRRCAAGRDAVDRRMVASGAVVDEVDDAGGLGGAGAEGEAPASALIRPPLAPTVNPAVPKVGARPSVVSERRTVSDAVLPAMVGGCITRMRLPVARASSSSGEWRSSSKNRGIGDGRAAWTSSWANTSVEGAAFSGDDAKCTMLSTVAARLPALRRARLVEGPERTATGRGPAMARASGANFAGTGRTGSAGRSWSASRNRAPAEAGATPGR
ncbi:MAG: hypothetical protein QOG30_1105 [Acidimicrobiaceae bacterium]